MLKIRLNKALENTLKENKKENMFSLVSGNQGNPRRDVTGKERPAGGKETPTHSSLLSLHCCHLQRWGVRPLIFKISFELDRHVWKSY